MPVHRCGFDDLEKCVETIERTTERIVSVLAPTDSTCVIVTYEPSKRTSPSGRERR